MSDYAASATPAAPTATSTEALSPERLAEIAAVVAELEADRLVSIGTWTASPVTEKSTLPPEQAYAVEDVAKLGGAMLRSSVGVFGDERHAIFTATARTALPALLADNARLRARVAALEAERHTTNEALSDAAETLHNNRDRIARLEAARQDGTPIPARWDRTVILPEHPNGDSDGDTIVCCIADDGTKRPIGLFLDDEHREALGLLLVDPDGDTEEAAR